MSILFLCDELRTKKVGVELRASDPNSLDLERATQIGYGAVSSLLRGDNGVFITLQQDDLAAVSISSVVGGGAGVRAVTFICHLYFHNFASKRIKTTPMKNLAPAVSSTGGSCKNSKSFGSGKIS